MYYVYIMTYFLDTSGLVSYLDSGMAFCHAAFCLLHVNLQHREGCVGKSGTFQYYLRLHALYGC